jgi:hypothetical protein
MDRRAGWLDSWIGGFMAGWIRPDLVSGDVNGRSRCFTWQFGLLTCPGFGKNPML